MRTALFISPHLDDAVFSCGGTLARLSAEGWQTILATVFTKSVPNPTGFALECQLDKGLSAGVDYMALRREEDQRAAKKAGVNGLLWLDRPEAPHRGYEGAPDLFGEIRQGDEIWAAIAEDLRGLIRRYGPGIIFAPQALGGHVDHRQVIRAALDVVPTEQVLWYRDLPYAIRHPEARLSPLLPPLRETCVNIPRYLGTKLDACAAYSTQLGFQFGDEKRMREALSRFAGEEAQRKGQTSFAEIFLSSPGTDLPI